MTTNITTTAKFQQKPDYYTSKEDCIASTRDRIQTNTRYKNFNQTHFTAGDVEQFADYCYDKNGKLYKEEISLNDNLFESHNFEIWKGNENLEAPDIANTFSYIFHKFKKGIFVKIMDNKLKVFLPFSNANFCNEWSGKIRYINNDIFKYVCDVEGRAQFNEKHVNEHKNTWFANNSLIRYEFPLNEGDTNVSNVKNMLDELCENRKVPDIEFFLNRRDFPILTKNYCEPYYDLWGSSKQELVSHKYEKYAPILSMSKTSNFADILIPIHEDWSRIQSKENKWFPRSFRSCDNDDTFSVNWDDKKEIAVFRGTSTGGGVTIDTNQRLKIVYMSTMRKRDPNDNLPYLDAGITKWNVRPRKLANSADLQVIDVNKLPFKLVDPLNYKQFCEYKYVIHCAGNVAAFRLGSELSMGSVILLVNSGWKLWFSDMIKPYEHYVPIKEDLSDLITQIKWCKKNDDKCKIIAQNARKFYDTYLQKNGVLDYLQKLLVDLKDKTGIYKYNDVKPLDIQLEYQKEFISQFMCKYPKTKKKIKDINELPLNIKRNNGLLKGMHYLINMINHQDSLENKIFVDDENMSVIFTNRTVVIKKYNFLGFPIVIKETTNEKKIKENYHEAFVGLTCINKLLKNIPNFCYTYGIYKNNVISEHLPGVSLFDYIKSDKFEFKEYVFILLQICIVLHVAQRECCLVHYDLTSWNIILQQHETPIEIEYVLDYDKVIKFHTSIVPIIIDYGKSHVVYDNFHYGFVNMYKFSTSHDILSLLITSIYQILVEQNVNKTDFGNLLKIANFLSGTKYRKAPFTNSRELKNFLYSAKKYSELLLSNKHELETKTPMDLFEYLNKNLKYKFKFDISTKYNSFMNKSSPEQIFEFILSSTQMDKVNSYINVLQKVKTYNYVDQCSDDILTFYKLQNLLDDFNNTAADLNEFAETTPSLNKAKFKTITKDLLKILKDKCQMYDDFEREELTFLTSFNRNIDNSFNESTFLLPNKIKEIIESYKNIDLDESIRSIAYRDVLESMILNTCFNKYFVIDKQYFIDSYQHLLKLDPYVIKNNIANILTINEVVEKLNIIENNEEEVEDDTEENDEEEVEDDTETEENNQEDTEENNEEEDENSEDDEIEEEI